MRRRKRVRSQRELRELGLLPPWLGRRSLHRSHRSLVRKDPETYSGPYAGPGGSRVCVARARFIRGLSRLTASGYRPSDARSGVGQGLDLGHKPTAAQAADRWLELKLKDNRDLAELTVASIEWAMEHIKRE